MPRVCSVSTQLPAAQALPGAIEHPHVHIGRSFGDSLPALDRYDLAPPVLARLSRSGRLAMAAGMDALARAGLISQESQWQLADDLQPHVGVVFASSFGHCEAALNTPTPLKNRLALDLTLQANVQLAQRVRARGPNTFSSNACASTTAAIKLACNALQVGDAKYMLVVAADAVLGNPAYDGLVASFVQLRAATDAEHLDRAAGAFAAQRDGFVFGEGAVALVLGDDDVPTLPSCQVEIVSSRIANSAYHGTQLDASHVAEVLGACVDQACARRGVSRAALAKHCLYVSHETATKLCARTEAEALRSVFGDAAPDILITNTKAFVGHAMGACVEDVAAVTALQEQRAPAVDVEHLDAEFADLSFSDGAPRRLDYAIHAAFGLGSHVAVVVYATTSN